LWVWRCPWSLSELKNKKKNVSVSGGTDLININRKIKINIIKRIFQVPKQSRKFQINKQNYGEQNPALTCFALHPRHCCSSPEQ
jgi:hypothetical protein